jgi:hypothetical protein
MGARDKRINHKTKHVVLFPTRVWTRVQFPPAPLAIEKNRGPNKGRRFFLSQINLSRCKKYEVSRSVT